MTDRNERPRSPEEMLERLEQMEADTLAQIRKFEEMGEQIGADAVEVYSEDGRIRVKLDAEGNVAEIGIDESAMRHRQSLGPMIVDLIQEATATYGMKMAQLTQSVIGDKIDIMGMMDQYMPAEMRDRARENLDRRRE